MYFLRKKLIIWYKGKVMKKIFQKIWCFIAGHDTISEYSLNNADIFDGIWRSAWGNHVCLRCGKEHPWNWDRP